MSRPKKTTDRGHSRVFTYADRSWPLENLADQYLDMISAEFLCSDLWLDLSIRSCRRANSIVSSTLLGSASLLLKVDKGPLIHDSLGSICARIWYPTTVGLRRTYARVHRAAIQISINQIFVTYSTSLCLRSTTSKNPAPPFASGLKPEKVRSKYTLISL